MGVVEGLSHLAGRVLLDEEQQAPQVILRSVRRQRRLKPNEVDELVALYESGLSMKELVARVKIQQTAVTAYLRRRGLDARRNRSKLSEEQEREAIRLYQGGLSLAAVGGVVGISPDVIRPVLIEAGILRQSPRHPVGSTVATPAAFPTREPSN